MGGAREGAGRKAAKIDLIELEKLCAMHCSDEEIAYWFNVSVRTLQNRRKESEFASVMRRGKTKGCICIRRAQMKLLEAGNATMGVWLGKSVLGQRDTSSIRMVLPIIRTAQDSAKAAEKVTQRVARGKLTPAQGEKMMSLIERQSRIIVAADHGSRIEKIEERLAAAPVSGPKITGVPDQDAEVTTLPSDPIDDVTAQKPELERGYRE